MRQRTGSLRLLTPVQNPDANVLHVTGELQHQIRCVCHLRVLTVTLSGQKRGAHPLRRLRRDQIYMCLAPECLDTHGGQLAGIGFVSILQHVAKRAPTVQGPLEEASGVGKRGVPFGISWASPYQGLPAPIN